MQVDQFIQLVANEPERTVRQIVWTTPSEVLAKAVASGGVSLTDLLSAPGRREELRDVKYLLAENLHLTAKTTEFLLLGRCQTVGASTRVAIGLRDPVPDRLCRWLELLGELLWATS